MKILDRYLTWGFLKSFLYCLSLFLVLFVVIDSFNNLDEFLKKGISPHIIFTYYGYLLPSIFVETAPIACLVAILYTLGNHGRHNEIVAMKASGVSSFHILSPYFFLGILISFLVLLTNETVVPQSSITSASIMEGLIHKGQKDFERRAIKNVTLYSLGHRMVFAREYEIETKTLFDVIVFEDNPNHITQTKITATKARYENNRWLFYDAMRYQMNRRGDVVGEPAFLERLEVPLDEKPEDFTRGASQTGYMNTKELRTYIEHLRGASDKLIQKLSVDLHYKIAFAFTSFIVILIGAPLAMRTRRGSALAGVGTSAVLVLSYYGINSMCLALGKGGTLPAPFAAWFSNLLYASIGLYLIRNTA